MIEPIVLRCKRCFYEWIRRLNFDPKECPKCKSRLWNTNYKQLEE